MELEQALKQRVCMPITVSGTAAHIVSLLLAENLLFPEDENRTLYFTGLRNDVKTSKNIQLTLTKPQVLLAVVQELCQSHNFRVATEGTTIVVTDGCACKA